ncbi:MAG TPA: radical SAM family heme chaperone HemW [Candidatus Binataceae bacterium]|jgi:oxygen-independent coproporphyrinogen-3 oxidase|nr:radical SAM family heme chaperone HemW [Candidatus Binataceae bacterium]
MSFSLYVHIPYCESKCPYCDFNSYAVKGWPEAEYVQALVAELRTRAAQAPWAGSALRTVFFGGGTPSLFQPSSLGRVLEEADRLFGIQADAEITAEANPGTVDLIKLRGMHEAGLNRVSFGAQSFNPKTLQFLGRIHSADQTAAAVEQARAGGFRQLNLDLIFAVPGQSVDDVAYDIATAAALGPDHISAYNLTFEEGTAFGAALKAGRMRQLPDDRQADMYAMVRSELPRRGYAMYEISNYARPGCEARHNLTYWRGESYLAIGAGAHSYAADGPTGRRWWNERLPASYIAKARRDGIAEAGNETPDAALSASEFAFLNLRLIDGLELSRFADRFGITFEERFGSRLERLIEGELLLREGGRVRLSERGLELADSVFAEFL